MTDKKIAEEQLVNFLASPTSSGYQYDVNKTASTYGETREGVLQVQFGLKGYPDFVRPNYQIIFGDKSKIAFRGDTHSKDNRISSEYNPDNLSSGFEYNGKYFHKVSSNL